MNKLSSNKLFKKSFLILILSYLKNGNLIYKIYSQYQQMNKLKKEREFGIKKILILNLTLYIHNNNLIQILISNNNNQIQIKNKKINNFKMNKYKK